MIIESVKVLDSHFVKSAVGLKDSMPSSHSEVAILGRSNVGKSTLINILLNHKLAKSSSTPGKTRLINFFKTRWKVEVLWHKNNVKSGGLEFIEGLESSRDLQSKGVLDSLKSSLTPKDKDAESSQIIELVIIDFPGFGYAKVDKKTRNMWDKNLSEFIRKRSSIKLFCHLIDSRHRELDIDSQIATFLESALKSQDRKDYKMLQIYTKADKLKANELHLFTQQGKLHISHKNNKEQLLNLYRAVLKETLSV